MELLNNFLDFIFTQDFYNLMGKLFTILLTFRVIKAIHKKIYNSVRWYQFNFDTFSLPVHWFNINYKRSVADNLNWFKVLSNLQDKPNKNIVAVRGYLIKFLYDKGYTQNELENELTAYRNSL